MLDQFQCDRDSAAWLLLAARHAQFRPQLSALRRMRNYAIVCTSKRKMFAHKCPPEAGAATQWQGRINGGNPDAHSLSESLKKLPNTQRPPLLFRSEERRVGKERRPRRSPHH